MGQIDEVAFALSTQLKQIGGSASRKVEAIPAELRKGGLDTKMWDYIQSEMGRVTSS